MQEQSLVTLLPRKGDDRPISNELYERLKSIISPACNTFSKLETDEGVTDQEMDNYNLSLILIKAMCCDNTSCQGQANNPRHAYYHLRTQCVAGTDFPEFHTTGQCRYCTSGIQTQSQRTTYWRDPRVKAFKVKKKLEAQILAEPDNFFIAA